MFENREKTEISELGEFGLIDHLTSKLTSNHTSTIKGVGDDAAVIAAGDSYQVISTDMLTEGVHFDLMYCPLRHLGYKSVIVNLSDIYAMNAHPKQITVSIAISSKFTLEAVEELYEGILTAAKLYNVDVIGGDTTSSTSGLTISITAIGEIQKEKISYRSGAKEHDILMVTGNLGAAFMGLQILEREREVFKSTKGKGSQPDLVGVDYLLERQLKPEARKDVIDFFEQQEVVPTSMIDISDGLASEVLHLAKQGDIGFHVYDEKLPIDQQTYNSARDFNLDPNVCALSGGEDYELLFTVSAADYEKLKENSAFTAIGYAMEKAAGVNLVDSNGALHPITAQGWKHFDKK